MNNDLTYLNSERLNRIFDGVYRCVEPNLESEPMPDEKIQALMDTLYVMQKFNYRFRPSDTRSLFDLFNRQFHFEINSDGTTLWLALILAIQELYAFSDSKLVDVIRQVTIRK